MSTITNNDCNVYIFQENVIQELRDNKRTINKQSNKPKVKKSRYVEYESESDEESVLTDDCDTSSDYDPEESEEEEEFETYGEDSEIESEDENVKVKIVNNGTINIYQNYGETPQYIIEEEEPAEEELVEEEPVRKIYIRSFSNERDELEKYGAEWDRNELHRYIYSDNPKKEEILSKWRETKKVYLPEEYEEPYKKYEHSKYLVAKWDDETQKRYIYDDHQYFADIKRKYKL
jgi:hypothetical protein